jgi:hypothetical protein
LSAEKLYTGKTGYKPEKENGLRELERMRQKMYMRNELVRRG